MVHKDAAKGACLLSVTDLEVLSAGPVPLGDATASINVQTPAATKSNARKLETPPEPSPSEE